MCLAAAMAVAVAAAKLLLARWMSRFSTENLTYNGSAV
jgi:hypothetical protein